MDATLYALLNDGATLLTASRRLSHRLRLEFALQAQQQGNLVWRTPRIMPWTTYLSEAFRQQRDGNTVLQLPGELQTRALWESIVRNSKTNNADEQLLNPSQAAHGAAHSWKLLHQYQIPLAAVAAYPGEEARVFTLWANEFISQTARNNWLDEARLSQWLQHSSYKPATSLVLRGFDRITPAMNSLLNHWQAQGSHLQIDTPQAHPSTVQVVAVRDADAELLLAARWARLQVERGKRRIAVVMPQLSNHIARVNRVFTAILAPEARSVLHDSNDIAMTVAASAALSSYPLIQHALHCLQLMQGDVDTALLGQVLRSPFIAGYEQEAATRALADIEARKQQRDRWQLHEVAVLASARQCPILGAALSKPVELQHALPSHWTERFAQLLNRIGWAQGRGLSSDEQQTRQKFQEVLAQLGSLDELLGHISYTQALYQLNEACKQQRFAPESDDQPIIIIDADTATGMEFDALWMMGLHAGEWPPAAEPDPFIPVELQWQYGVEQSRAETCLQAARTSLHHLAGSADEIILSWPRHDGDAELRVSPLLAAWPTIEASALSVSTVTTLAEALMIQRPVLEMFIDERLPVHPGGLVKQGSRLFELQSRCAFRAQAELRLHATSPEAVSLGVQALDRGIFIHQILYEVWQQLQSWQGLQTAMQAENELRNEIQRIAIRIAQRVMPATTLYKQRLIAVETELAVKAIMRLLHLECQRSQFSVCTSEQRELFAVGVLKVGIQPDRIDELSDGSMLLLDYKTGDSYKTSDWLDHSVAGRPRSPQLPLYALAHRQNLAGIAYAVMAPGKAELRGLAETANVAPGVHDYRNLKPSNKIAGVDDWQQLLTHWQHILNDLAAQFINGEAQVDPLKNECIYCTLAGLCRIKEVMNNSPENDAVEEGSDDR